MSPIVSIIKPMTIRKENNWFTTQYWCMCSHADVLPLSSPCHSIRFHSASPSQRMPTIGDHTRPISNASGKATIKTIEAMILIIHNAPNSRGREFTLDGWWVLVSLVISADDCVPSINCFAEITAPQAHLMSVIPARSGSADAKGPRVSAIDSPPLVSDLPHFGHFHILLGAILDPPSSLGSPDHASVWKYRDSRESRVPRVIQG